MANQTRCTSSFANWLPVPALLFIFWLMLAGLGQESLWNDEAWSIWAVNGPWSDTLHRVALDVHPPLYFMLLDGWLALTGQSAFAGRMLSVAAGLLGAAVVYALGRLLFDAWAGLIALVLLGSNSFFIYYSREIRMYSLLLLAALACMWAYARWRRTPNRRRLIIYGLSASALPYIHYYGWLIVLTQGMHLLLTRPRHLKSWLIMCGLALLLYLPWLLVVMQQINTNPSGPQALPLPTDISALHWLWLLLTGGAGLWLFAPFLPGMALPRLRAYGEAIVLLLLWLLVTPVVLLALNAWLAPLYQVRYVIGALPAIALLAAYGLRQMWWKAVAVLFMLGVVANSLMTYGYFWPPKAPWPAVITRSLGQTRRPDEPLLMLIRQPYSLEAYYSRQMELHDEATIDLSDRPHTPGELQAIVASLAETSSVWMMMPNNIPATWITAAALTAERTIGYRDNAAYMLFYRFDAGSRADLTFDFGDKLRYTGQLFAGWPAVMRGERFCVDTALLTLNPLDGEYSMGVHLVDDANRLVAQHDAGLGVQPAGKSIQLRPCLDIPPDVASGHYPLHLVIYDWRDGDRLSVQESEQVFWGNSLVFGGVTVE